MDYFIYALAFVGATTVACLTASLVLVWKWKRDDAKFDNDDWSGEDPKEVKRSQFLPK